MQKMKQECDILIFGGGVAGLWLLNRLSQVGYDALLLERDALGSGQSIHSQGIIHGGVKYSLTGSITGAANQIANMPARWRKCLAGEGDIDLSAVTVQSQHHYLWTTHSTRSKVSTFLASSAMRNRAHKIEQMEYPTALRDPAFLGSVYQLDEVVIDVPSLIETLIAPVSERILQISWADTNLAVDSNSNISEVNISDIQLRAQHYIFAAGAGNEAILKLLNAAGPAMQKRPLRMTVVKRNGLPELYAHCLGNGTKPRVTITTHQAKEGTPLWYIGGELAETGAHRTAEAHLAHARKELSSLLPWVDLEQAHWGSFLVDRAEPKIVGGTRPDNAFAQRQSNYTVTWPTKLALTPALADLVIEKMVDITPKTVTERNAVPLPLPPIARPAWNVTKT